MTDKILAGLAKKSSSSPGQIILTVSRNPELVQITVNTHAPSQGFSGTYYPRSHSAQVYVSDAELAEVKADVAAAKKISVTLTYVIEDNQVKRFCYPTRCVARQVSRSVAFDSISPDSGVKVAAGLSPSVHEERVDVAVAAGASKRARK